MEFLNFLGRYCKHAMASICAINAGFMQFSYMKERLQRGSGCVCAHRVQQCSFDAHFKSNLNLHRLQMTQPKTSPDK